LFFTYRSLLCRWFTHWTASFSCTRSTSTFRVLTAKSIRKHFFK